MPLTLAILFRIFPALFVNKSSWKLRLWEHYLQMLSGVCLRAECLSNLAKLSSVAAIDDT